MATVDLQQKFPDMQPVGSAPWLFRVNGFGCAMHGRRDFDDETATYLSTWCVTLLFIPIFGLRTYRVADAETGWYFLGREPVSAMVKAWNALFSLAMICAISFGGWALYSNTPTYQAKQRMAQASQLMDTGHFADASRAYAEVAAGQTSYAADADNKLHALVDSGIDAAPAAEVVGVIDTLLYYKSPEQIAHAYPDLNTHLLRLANKHAGSDPRGALDMIDSVRIVYEPTDEVTALRESLLEKIVAKNPGDLDALSELAMIFEFRGDEQKCLDLLTPHTDKLTDTEGARVLGQLYAARGEVEPAYKLLKPYTSARLERLRKAEESYDSAMNRAWEQQINQLNNGSAPNSFYQRYDQATEAEQDAIVEAYVQDKIKDDPAINHAVTRLIEESAVVPVALDLGMVMLGRASQMPDPDAKRAELEDAEQTFLAIRGLAGETDEYRMYLGQVYYWLGKADQGKQLLNELLDTHQRSFEVLTAVAATLREVGAVSEARALAEEAYRHTKDTAQKYQAARLRSLLQLDLDDEIRWLQRANPTDTQTQAALNAALGTRAANHGKTDEAIKHIRDAIQGYESQPESTASLNNTALAYLSLFEVDGDPDTLKKAITLMDKAVALVPSDSILMHNTTTMHVQAAVYDLVKDKIDLVALHAAPNIDMLSYLYDDAEQREQVFQQFTSHPSTAKAQGYSERMMLVSPQRAASYTITYMVHHYADDAEQLNRLLKRIRSVEIDLTDTLRERFAYYAGESDEKYHNDLSGQIEKWRAVVDQLQDHGEPTTRAYALSSLVETMLAAAKVGYTTDADEMVALAQQAFQTLPCSGTRAILKDASCYRAIRQLSAQDSTFAGYASDCSHTLGPRYFIALALCSNDPTSATVAKHPDVIRLIEMTETGFERYPGDSHPLEWALLNKTRPALAQEAARFVKDDEVDRVSRVISRSLNGDSAELAILLKWEAQITGDTAEANAALKTLQNAAVTLPPVTW